MEGQTSMLPCPCETRFVPGTRTAVLSCLCDSALLHIVSAKGLTLPQRPPGHLDFLGFVVVVVVVFQPHWIQPTGFPVSASILFPSFLLITHRSAWGLQSE